MSYLKTVYLKNEDTKTPLNIYTCDVCNNEITEACSYFEIKKYHICINCFEQFIFDYVKMSGLGGTQPFVLYEAIEQKYKKKKRYTLSKKIRNKVLKKYNFICQKCGTSKNLTIDHIKPFIEGGKDNFNNLQILCKSCNSSKGTKTIDYR